MNLKKKYNLNMCIIIKNHIENYLCKKFFSRICKLISTLIKKNISLIIQKQNLIEVNFDVNSILTEKKKKLNLQENKRIYEKI